MTHARFLQCVFETLGFVFKYLRKPLIQQLNQTFDLISPLLTDKNEYIRQFTAPSIAFLLRKVAISSLTDTLQHILLSVDKTHENMQDYVESIAFLLFETIKVCRGAES